MRREPVIGVVLSMLVALASCTVAPARSAPTQPSVDPAPVRPGSPEDPPRFPARRRRRSRRIAGTDRFVIVGRWVVRDLEQPVAFDFDQRGRIWFVEKATGDVRIFDPATSRHHRFYHVTDLVTESEQGLVGIALGPDPLSTPTVYLFATRLVRGRPTDQILRLTSGDGGSREVDVIYASPASPLHQHSGGRLLFGPDGMLYVTIGDASDPGDAQDLASTRGKILRLTPEGEAAPGNPSGSRVWAFGDPQLLRSGIRSEERKPLGDRERPGM